MQTIHSREAAHEKTLIDANERELLMRAGGYLRKSVVVCGLQRGGRLNPEIESIPVIGVNSDFGSIPEIKANPGIGVNPEIRLIPHFGSISGFKNH